MQSKPPTKKQRVFIEEYLRCWNASEAARRAGYKTKANVIGAELIALPSIKAVVEKRIDEMKMDTDEVLSRLASYARGSLEPFIRINDDGTTDFDFSHPDAKKNIHLIKKIKTKRKILVEGKGDEAESWEHEWVEVELHDPVHCLELIGKHKRLFEENVNLNLGGKIIEVSLTNDE